MNTKNQIKVEVFKKLPEILVYEQRKLKNDLKSLTFFF